MASTPRSSLKRYRSKRDFSRTPEPKPDRADGAGGNRYLIQKHAARRLHYDFRLELEGVLKSWAVTKGPSLDPAVRRLAVHVEDHPLAYGSFEGVIPQGQYGGGTVMLWDRGTWEPVGDARQGYAAGKLKFLLHGERLKGGWTLVRMHGRAEEKGRDNWLLIKERDEFAQPGDDDRLLAKIKRSVVSDQTMDEIADPAHAKVWQSNKAAKPKPERRSKTKTKIGPIKGAKAAALPDFVAPELALLVEKPPDGADWLHEIKIDGYRCYARRDGDEVRLLTRTGQDWTARFGGIAQAVRELPGQRLALDGEVAVFNEQGQSSFGALQEALSEGHGDRLSFTVFDLLHLDGRDLLEVPLRERKRVLRELIPPDAETSRLRYSDHVESTGADVFHHACQLALEGIVSKHAAAPYRSGRGGDWVKSKCLARQEFVIGGFTAGKNAREGGLGALLLGCYEEEELHYAGRVGTGFSLQLARDLLTRLTRLKTAQPAFVNLPSAARRGAIFVRPELVCEVEFTGWTRDGVLRHPAFQGLREDKPPKSVHRDRAAKSVAAIAAPPPAKTATKASSNGVAGIVITHPDRLVFPDSGITKLDLARYYESVAEWMLPEIANRPLSLLRCPDGIAGQCFFQKHFATGVKALKRVAIQEHHGVGEYVLVRDVSDLVSLAQEGVVEIHPWGAHADDPEKPDRLIIDLDPDPSVGFASVIASARTVRKLLEQAGLDPFVKTTGGKGLHVVVPLKRRLSWPQLKAFARGVAEALVQGDPSAFTANVAKRERTGKIFVDYLRNDRGSTAVAAYAVRARPGAPVAMPATWEELKPSFDPRRFTLETVPDFLKARRADPWRGIGIGQSLPSAVLKALAAHA
jgi:bifunctional non-homologous end joining protein LigD